MEKFIYTFLIFLVAGTLRADMGTIYYLELEYQGERYFHKWITDGIEVDQRTLLFKTRGRDTLLDFNSIRAVIFHRNVEEGLLTLYKKHQSLRLSMYRSNHRFMDEFNYLSMPVEFTSKTKLIENLILVAVVGVGFPGGGICNGVFMEGNPWPVNFKTSYVGVIGHKDCEYEFYTYQDWFLPTEIEEIMQKFKTWLENNIDSWKSINSELNKLYDDGILVTTFCSC